MGAEGGGDPQRIKKIAAAAYDYESDPRWADYWSNILVPPHMASRSDVVDHFKHKFYRRYLDPDLVVETMSLSNSSQPARTSSGSSSPPVTERSRSQGPTTGTSAAPGRGATSIRLDRRTIHFFLNAWVLVVAVLGMLPVMSRTLSNKAYRLSLLGTTCSSLYSLYTLYGVPRERNLPAIQSWFQSIIATKDFIHFLYCLMFMSSRLHFKFALIPVFCWALEHVAKFLRRNFTHSSLYRYRNDRVEEAHTVGLFPAVGADRSRTELYLFIRRYLEAPCLWVEANTTTLGILSSNVETSLGFLLIISLFSWQRNVVQTFMYWQLLKLMYHAPGTSGYHQSVWAGIGRTTTPYIHRYTPFLNTPISIVQRWWFR